jgi:hypothetical protein
MKNTLTFKNYQLSTLIKCLNYNIPFQQGRTRQRFLDFIKTKTDSYATAEKDLFLKYGEKNENQKLIVTNGQIKVSNKKVNKFNEEFKMIKEENCIIDILPSIEPDIEPIRNILEKTTVEMNIETTKILSEIIAVFDDVLASKKSEKKGRANIAKK